MAVTSDKPAPYCPPSAVIEIIERYRARGLPLPVTSEVLGRAGISESLIPRTLQGLQTLDLIDDAGQPTATFEGIRTASESEYKERLVNWLNSAYSEVVIFVDPATADETAVRDAFRTYIPIGQQPRMVTLFMGLWAAAGVRPEKNTLPRATRPQRIATVARSPRAAVPASAKTALQQKLARAMQHNTDLPEPIAGMLTRLPPNGSGWTQIDRDKFLSTFGTVLDFCFPIVTQAARDAEDKDGED